MIYREPPSKAEKEAIRKWRKMVLELRTEREPPLGCDGSARDSDGVSAGLPVLTEVIAVKLW